MNLVLTTLFRDAVMRNHRILSANQLISLWSCASVTVSLAPEAMAASSSSVMSMSHFITVGSLVFRVGGLP